MSKTKNQSVTWHFLAGLLITEAGFGLLAFGELYPPGTWMHHLSYGGVFLFCLGMILMSWQKVCYSKTLHIHTVPNPTAVAVREKLIGEINVKAISSKRTCRKSIGGANNSAYLPSPRIDSEHEARYVRYLIHEGFIDQRWPLLSNKIKEEAG